ncbi:hypothetical protein ABIQ69_12165 [Agromyces sp. G08B096]|uniref:Uncharacterized protein n=1 Tax=Agromyces sp. G08B096 TaxID=3156399 RepID=A0AAU7W4J7_9MICO
MSHREPHAATRPQPGRVMGMRGCEAHEACRSDRPGHGLNAVQARVARATPSRWVDAVVLEAGADGFVTVAALDGGLRRVWHHAPLGGRLRSGEPVALHAVYGVLAVGDEHLSVAAA